MFFRILRGPGGYPARLSIFRIPRDLAACFAPLATSHPASANVAHQITPSQSGRTALRPILEPISPKPHPHDRPQSQTLIERLQFPIALAGEGEQSVLCSKQSLEIGMAMRESPFACVCLAVAAGGSVCRRSDHDDVH